MSNIDRPNFLIVMTDQQRADAVSVALDGWTPHVAAFARDAAHLRQTYCPSPHCAPSRASFFTGVYPSRHGIWNNILNTQALTRDPIPGTRFWSESLASAGYELHFAGKWHVAYSSTPRDYGWTEHFLSGVSHLNYHGPRWNYYEKLAACPRRTRPRGGIERPGWGDTVIYQTMPSGYTEPHDEQTTDAAVCALRGLKGSARPWMLYAGLIGPHDPYQVPPEWIARIPDEACALPASYTDTLRDKPVIYQRLRNQIWGQLSPDEVREARRHYLAYCAYVDNLFGKIMAALREIGAEENTVVVFLSDHGDYLGDHGLFYKGVASFRGAYHVPCFVRWPRGGIDGSRATDALISLTDFGPTFLELAGIAAPPGGFSGRSLAPLLRPGNADSRAAAWRDTLYTQCNGLELYYSQRMVFTRDWKYVFNGFDRDELYDLGADPHEMRNLAAEPGCRPVIREMCRRMWKFAHEQDDEIINNYHTAALAPFGPAEAFRVPDAHVAV